MVNFGPLAAEISLPVWGTPANFNDLRGTPPPGELNTRGVVKYSDFGPIEGYISESVQDRRYVSINH